MDTILHSDTFSGTKLVFNSRPNGESTVTLTVAAIPFSKHTVTLDLDEVDRLLAVREHAVNPEADIAEYLHSVHHVQPDGARRGADAIVWSAGSLADLIYN